MKMSPLNGLAYRKNGHDRARLGASAKPITSSADTSSMAVASIHWVCCPWVASDRVNDGVGDHFAVVHDLPRRELQALRRAHHHIDVASDAEHGRQLRELGPKHRVVGLALEAITIDVAHDGCADDVPLVVRVVKQRLAN